MCIEIGQLKLTSPLNRMSVPLIHHSSFISDLHCQGPIWVPSYGIQMAPILSIHVSYQKTGGKEAVSPFGSWLIELQPKLEFEGGQKKEKGKNTKNRFSEFSRGGQNGLWKQRKCFSSEVTDSRYCSSVFEWDHFLAKTVFNLFNLPSFQ